MNNNNPAPRARKVPKILEKHGHRRQDDYYWLNDRNNPEVIAYLTEENAYYHAQTAHTKDFQERLFQEMKARIKEDDQSVPYFYNQYWYYTRFEKGGDYPLYCRKKQSPDAAEEIMFDGNKMAKGHAFFQMGGISVSPDNQWAAFGLDVIGRRIYTIRIKNLKTGKVIPGNMRNTNGHAVWANDSKTLFYATQDKKTLRTNKIFRHVKGQGKDVLIYEEKDDTFHIDVSKSKSNRYVYIESGSTLTTETRILDADKPMGKFRVFTPRKRGHEYSVSHYDGQFYIRTNKDKAVNFKLMKTAESDTRAKNWKDVIPHRDDVLLESMEIFRDYLVLEERFNGLNHIRIMPWNGAAEYYLPFESETYTAYATANLDFDTEVLRYGYQSLATPPSVVDFNMRTKQKTVRKEQPVLGGFDKKDYVEQRVWAIAADGARIPISMVYRKGMKKNGKNPLLQYAYGSYGHALDAYFSSTRLSLLDRGFIYAIAHVRGGEDLGRQWYETGKLLRKMNTFTDFIDCSKFLISENYTSPEHLYAEGGSAGGLLVGAVINMAPQLYHGAIAQVPFVDVVTTMLDDSIPLTTGEYDEWGNPNTKRFYDYMLSYSPYDNVKKQEYPHLYISTGLHDSQVQYWEPAKWVAKLREMKTDDRQLFLDTNMEAGHGGASGRFEALRELAREFSFFLDLEGIKN